MPCNATSATQEVTGCPKLANCIENRTVNGSVEGYCLCAANYAVNQNYASKDNSSQYCIERKSDDAHPIDASPTTATKIPTALPPTTLKPETTSAAKTKPTEPATTPTSTTTTTTTTKKPEADKSDVKVAPAPEPHHIFGGILLPIFIVLGFIGLVFAVRKYNLIERAHGYIRNRNQQTRYNGLMENDFDDDPLLI